MWKYLALLMLLPQLAFAATPKDIPSGDDVIVSVKKGAVAPFNGQLFSSETALRWANWLQQYKLMLELDVQYEKDVCREELGYRDRLLIIEKERSAVVEKSLRDELLKSEKGRLAAEEVTREGPPWYDTVEFGIVVGTAISAGVFALSIWALEARND